MRRDRFNAVDMAREEWNACSWLGSNRRWPGRAAKRPQMTKTKCGTVTPAIR